MGLSLRQAIHKYSIIYTVLRYKYGSIFAVYMYKLIHRSYRMNIISKRVISLLSLSFILFFTVPSMASNIKGQIAVINAQKIVSESKLGKEAAKELEDKFGKDRNKLEADVKAYQEKEADFQKKLSALSAQAKEKQSQELLKERQRLETESATLTRKLQAEDARLREKLLKAILEAAQEVGKKLGVTMILDGNQAGLLYVQEKYDITNDVLKAMDANYK